MFMNCGFSNRKDGNDLDGESAFGCHFITGIVATPLTEDVW